MYEILKFCSVVVVVIVFVFVVVDFSSDGVFSFVSLWIDNNSWLDLIGFSEVCK